MTGRRSRSYQTDPSQLIIGQCRHILAIEQVLPAGRTIERPEYTHERRLPRSAP